MKAAIYEKYKGKIEVQNVPEPTINEHGVIIKVLATGLCRSDWHGWMGHDKDICLPHVPGHELAGEIVEIGKEVRKFKIGDRITVPFVCGCGNCEQCRTGNQQICDFQSQPGFTHWGSFAEYVKIDYADTNLVNLPEEIDDKTASVLGCRFITSYRALVAQAKIQDEQFVSIHGCGGVGLSAIMIAKAKNAQVIAIDIDEDALLLAKQIGADYVINGLNNDHLIDHIKELSQGGVHISMDALGSQETCFNSISSLKKRGRHVQVGLMTESAQYPKIPMDMVIAHELEIYGSHGMQAHQYPEMLEQIREGKLQPQKLIENTITLEESTKILPEMGSFKTKGVWIINDFK